MSHEFTIAETDTFKSSMKSIRNQKLYEKITSYVYPQLKQNPYSGLNIKKLKGSLEGLYRYRIGNYRLFYVIENKKLIVALVEIALRKDAY